VDFGPATGKTSFAPFALIGRGPGEANLHSSA